jgi:hypothetical protein
VLKKAYCWPDIHVTTHIYRNLKGRRVANSACPLAALAKVCLRRT